MLAFIVVSLLVTLNTLIGRMCLLERNKYPRPITRRMEVVEAAITIPYIIWGSCLIYKHFMG